MSADVRFEDMLELPAGSYRSDFNTVDLNLLVPTSATDVRSVRE